MTHNKHSLSCLLNLKRTCTCSIPKFVSKLYVYTPMILAKLLALYRSLFYRRNIYIQCMYFELGPRVSLHSWHKKDECKSWQHCWKPSFDLLQCKKIATVHNLSIRVVRLYLAFYFEDTHMKKYSCNAIWPKSYSFDSFSRQLV